MEKKNHHHHVLLDKYEFLRLLGRGSFAKVYLARSVSSVSNSPAVAIKVLDKCKIVAAGLEQRLLHEVSAMRRLSHPNILKIHEVLATKSKVFLVMDHAGGGDLSTLLARRCGQRLSESQARRYFFQLVSALSYCHSMGITHRDIKPQNLLVDKDGNLKVCDFGLAALPEKVKDGRLQTACGTPAYTAPEVLCRKGYDGAKADAWSCGVVLYTMLVGRLPFDFPNYYGFLQLAVRGRRCKFPALSSVSPMARRLVYKLLDLNPDTRIGLDAVVEHPWLNKGLTVGSAGEIAGVRSDCSEECSVSCMNAFGIISMSSGLDLSGLFHECEKKRMMRFLSRESTETIVGKMKEIGKKLGYVVERRSIKDIVDSNVGFGRVESVVLLVEVLEVFAPLHMVEIRARDGSEEGFSWEELEMELSDVLYV